MLIMTVDDANQVRGLTTLGHALAPKPLADGTFALPEACLTDPAHQSKWPIMRTFDIMLDSLIRQGTPSIPGDPSSPIINSDYSQDPVVNAANTYKSEWPVGQLIVVG